MPGSHRQLPVSPAMAGDVEGALSDDCRPITRALAATTTGGPAVSTSTVRSVTTTAVRISNRG
jgi:hypothetical protein